MDKRIEVAKKMGLFFSRISPQIKGNLLQYYISGSLAAMILGSAEEIIELEINPDGQIIGERESKGVTPEQRAKIQTFSRKLGVDVDIVNVQGDFFVGAPRDCKPEMRRIEENAPGAYELMEWNPRISGTGYIDRLDDERVMNTHPVVRVRTKEGDILVTAPPELLAHKLSETIYYCTTALHGDNKKSYEKDLRDSATLFYGFYELYGEEFLERVFTALMEKDRSQFVSIDYDLEEGEEQIVFQRLKEDCMAMLLEIANPKVAEDFSLFFDKLLEKRKKALEEQITK